MGVDAVVESVGMVRDGSAPKIDQDHSQATYEGWCRAEDVVIDWNKPVEEIYNVVRGGDPSPGANTTLDGSPVGFFRASRLDGDTGRPGGEVVEIRDEGFTVAADGGAIFVGRVQPAGGPKAMAPEWVRQVGIKPGTRFGT
jgi:methionyl-tRNA formyltransferase